MCVWGGILYCVGVVTIVWVFWKYTYLYVLCFLYCFFYVHLFLFVTSVRTTATE